MSATWKQTMWIAAASVFLLAPAHSVAASPEESGVAAPGSILPDQHPRREQLWWATPAPNAIGDEDEDKPVYDVYLPPAEKASKTGIVICPGGGYGKLEMDEQARQIARWLNSYGVAAFVLKYRVSPRYSYSIAIMDAQRAVRLVRAKAKDYHLAPDHVGIWGFSAGGYVASMAATRFDDGDPRAADPIEQKSSRPDFMVLTYPVISLSAPFVQKMPKMAQMASAGDPKMLSALSVETQVTDRTPPTFLFHSQEDTGVPTVNSVVFYLALRQHGVPAELHVYEQSTLSGSDSLLAVWPERLADWMRQRDLIDSHLKLAQSGR